MRYVVAEGAIGPDGRTVRCASCGHQWFEKGEEGLDEELFSADPAPSFMGTDASESMDQDDEADDFQSILRKEIDAAPLPEGVKPVPEDDPVLAMLGKQPKKRSAKADKMAGYLLAAAIWLCIVAVLFLLHPQISRAWPPSNLFYSLVGLKPVPPGEGLALEHLNAEITGDKIRMTGEVLNLQSEPLKVPAIMATILDADENVLDNVFIAAPVARLKAEGQVPFDVTYNKSVQGAHSVKFAFSFVDIGPVDFSHDKPVKEDAEKHEEFSEPSTPAEAHVKEGHAPTAADHH